MPRGVFASLGPADVPLHVKIRFLRYVLASSNFAEDGECWIWPKSTASHGYGQIGWGVEPDRRLVLAHRMAYLLFIGPIPEGLTVDHVCRNRPCCNPTHLRLLTNLENASDNGPARRTHCPQGHPYQGLNLIVRPNGHRYCRACREARNEARRHARRVA